MHLYTGTALAERVTPLAQFLGAEAVLIADESGGDPLDETCGRVWWESAKNSAQNFRFHLLVHP